MTDKERADKAEDEVLRLTAVLVEIQSHGSWVAGDCATTVDLGGHEYAHDPPQTAKPFCPYCFAACGIGGYDPRSSSEGDDDERTR